MSRSSWIGQTLGGRYQLEQLLGQGGMSAVYKATDPNLRRTVAIKLIHTHLASDPEFVRRFEEEAAAVARLRHHNIVQVYDFNHDGDTCYMVLEFVPGETLQDKLREISSQGQLLPLDQIIAIGVNVCEAVQYAHNQGMIHRDLKPANVMITPKEEAILMDFGIAKIVGGENLTATGAMIGTAAYMAPEQIRGQRPDHRVDIYALGVILFEMASGRRPFVGDSAPSTMMMHLTEPVPDIRQINQSVSPELIKVIEKSLAKEPGERYQSAAELAFALRGVNSHAAVSPIYGGAVAAPPSPPMNRPPTASPQTGAYAGAPTGARAGAGSQTGPQTGSQAAPPAARSSRPWIFAAVGVAVLFLLTLICGAAIISGQFLGGGGSQAAAQTAEAEQAAVAAVQTTEAETTATAEAEQLARQTEAAATGEAQALAEAAALAANATQTAQADLSATAEAAAAVAEQTSIAVTARAATAAASVPSPTATYPPVATPTLAPTPSGPYVQITRITLNNNIYEVYYEPSGYTPVLPGMHIHFFYNTVPPENAGSPGSGPWELYAGPMPFTRYTTSNRPSAATQICALVANPNHSVIAESGNCMDIP
jgi:hypothetical protein